MTVGVAAGGGSFDSAGRVCRKRRKTLAQEQSLLIFQQSLESSPCCLLSFKKLTVQTGSVFLHLLQNRHALTSHPQRFNQSITRGRSRLSYSRLNLSPEP